MKELTIGTNDAGQRLDRALAALTPLVQEVFTISRFNLIVPCYATVDAACEVLGT